MKKKFNIQIQKIIPIIGMEYSYFYIYQKTKSLLNKNV